MRRIENLQNKTLITKGNIEKEIFENKQQQNFIMGYKEKYSKVLKKKAKLEGKMKDYKEGNRI